MSFIKSDEDFKKYQEDVCKDCKHIFDLQRGMFTQGCMVVDMHGMFGSVTQIIKDNGKCICYEKALDKE